MTNYAIGVDVGGTKIAAGLVNLRSGRIYNQIKIKTETEKGSKKLVENIVRSAREVSGSKKIYKIGIGIAGQIDTKSGRVVFSPNMPRIKNLFLVKIVRQNISSKALIKVDNDANCFALAEYIFGAGKSARNMVGITLGTGVGGGIIIDGKLYHGQAYASELGHMVINFNGQRCSCRKIGCLEAYVSGTAIEREYKRLTKKYRLATEIEEEALKNKRGFAFQVYKDAGKYLGVGLANVVNILDPEVIVIGGGIGRSKLIYESAIYEMKKRTFYRGRKTRVIKSKLNDKAGIIGAALLVK